MWWPPGRCTAAPTVTARRAEPVRGQRELGGSGRPGRGPGRDPAGDARGGLGRDDREPDHPAGRPTRRWPRSPGTPAVPLCVDSTFASPACAARWSTAPTWCMHSATKYMGGHSDVTGGVIVAARPELRTGPRGPDRHRRLCSRRTRRTCCAAACSRCRCGWSGSAHPRWSSPPRWPSHPAVEAVAYPGLARHPDHAAGRQAVRPRRAGRTAARATAASSRSPRTAASTPGWRWRTACGSR